jgi:hypothetical protein
VGRMAGVGAEAERGREAEGRSLGGAASWCKVGLARCGEASAPGSVRFQHIGDTCVRT